MASYQQRSWMGLLTTLSYMSGSYILLVDSVIDITYSVLSISGHNSSMMTAIGAAGASASSRSVVVAVSTGFFL